MVKKKGRGNARSKREIEASKEEMRSLIAKGLTQKSVFEIMVERHKVSTRTLERYWASLYEEYKDKLAGVIDREIIDIRFKAKKRMEESAINYFKEKTAKWIKEWRDEDYAYVRFLQSIGVIEKAPENVKLEGSLELTPFKALEDVLEEHRKKKKARQVSP